MSTAHGTSLILISSGRPRWESCDYEDRDQTLRKLRGQGKKEFIEAEEEMGKKRGEEIFLRKGETKEMQEEKGSEGIRME